jgi:Holliday junction resolvasome, endonuclease subunit
VKVAGLDLSLTSTGIAVIRDRPRSTSGLDQMIVTTHRVISVAPKLPRGAKPTIRQRRDRIARVVSEIAECVLPGLDLAVIEGPSYGSFGGQAWDRAWLWGAVVERMIGNGVSVAIVQPATRALWATGSGSSSKSPIAVHMSRMWPQVDPGVSDDEWDGLALASMGAQHLGMIPCELARHRQQLDKVSWPDFPAGVELAS